MLILAVGLGLYMILDWFLFGWSGHAPRAQR
ncbi:hypothetical protein B0G84_2367 [Paraburkholderia sp. BL8N3]|nr:hypothetical protein B0G84_2367 [Paraburkholderia sp. BL8N3]